ncbi:MAG: hypothetical protein AAGI15_02805 [Pseudomonadota bacterium]
MTALLRELWQLCLFRSSPARLPGGWSLTLILLALDWLISVLVVLQLRPELERGTMMTSIGLSNLLLLVLFVITLTIRRRSSRAPQTLSAVFGTDLVLTVLFALLLAVASTLADTIGTSPTAVLRVLLVLWTIALYGYILHQALDMPQILSTLVAFGIIMAGVSISQLVLEASAQ